MNTRSLCLPSFAKINLYLRILGRRSDGYHDIQTVFQTISLADELRLEIREDGNFALTCDDPTVPTGSENLIIRACRALRNRHDLPYGANIHLSKRIPTQAGLGGGSSNAAIALLGLARLWELPQTDLVGVASEIGADVPFFLTGGRALGQGIGTSISPLSDCQKRYLIIVSPRVSVATSSAYAAIDARSLTYSGSIPILAGSSVESLLDDCDQCPLHNDFEAVIFEMEREIERAKMTLLQSGAQGALLAGSGSSVFGIFATEEARQIAFERLECEPGWRTFFCETLARSEYLERVGVFQSQL